MKKELNPTELDFLLRFPFKAGVVSPVDFLQNQGWGGIKVSGPCRVPTCCQRGPAARARPVSRKMRSVRPLRCLPKPSEEAILGLRQEPLVQIPPRSDPSCVPTLGPSGAPVARLPGAPGHSGCAVAEDGAGVCPQALSDMDEFKNLDSDIEGSAKRWKKLVESEAPEKEIFPKEWKNKSSLQKLCMVRCMRPDRMTYAVK